MIKNNNNIANHKLKCYCIFFIKKVVRFFFIFLNEKKNSKIRLVQIGK